MFSPYKNTYVSQSRDHILYAMVVFTEQCKFYFMLLIFKIYKYINIYEYIQYIKLSAMSMVTFLIAKY